jgi:hypothetical protein
MDLVGAAADDRMDRTRRAFWAGEALQQMTESTVGMSI